MRADGAHESLLGQQRGSLDGGSHAHANQQRRTGVQTVGGHLIQDEIRNALVARAGHQHHGLAGQGAAATGHIGIDFTLVRIGDDIPPDGRGTLTHIALGVVLVEGLHGVVAQRGGKGCLNNSLFQQGFQFIDVGEIGAAFQPELNDAGILAAGPIQLHGQVLVLGHGFVEHLGQGGGFLATQLFQLGNHVVGQLLADVANEIGHHVGKLFYIFFLSHRISSNHNVLYISRRRGTGWAAARCRSRRTRQSRAGRPLHNPGTCSRPGQPPWCWRAYRWG